MSFLCLWEVLRASCHSIQCSEAPPNPGVVGLSPHAVQIQADSGRQATLALGVDRGSALCGAAVQELPFPSSIFPSSLLYSGTPLPLSILTLAHSSPGVYANIPAFVCLNSGLTLPPLEVLSNKTFILLHSCVSALQVFVAVGQEPRGMNSTHKIIKNNFLVDLNMQPSLKITVLDPYLLRGCLVIVWPGTTGDFVKDAICCRVSLAG